METPKLLTLQVHEDISIFKEMSYRNVMSEKVGNRCSGFLFSNEGSQGLSVVRTLKEPLSLLLGSLMWSDFAKLPKDTVKVQDQPP